MGTEYATIDTILPEKDLHVRGTIPRGGGRLEFWMTTPRPVGADLDEWDEITKGRWDRAFGKEGPCKK